METRAPKTVFVAVIALLAAASFAGAVAFAQSAAARPDSNLGPQLDFNAGSGIALSGLTRVQTANLANLGQVWGFLKYHHPKVTSGRLQWDHELFRVMPAVLAATDRAAASAVLQQWIQRMGELKPGRGSDGVRSGIGTRPL